MSTVMRALFAGAALSCLFAPAAFADDPQEAHVVEQVIVTARRDPEDPPVVADARQRLSETPGAVAVVAAEVFEDRYANTLADALRDVAGVYAQEKWGEDLRLSIRGSGLGNNFHNRGVLIAQDGLPFNEADGFGDFQLIDPLTARFIEVYKGGNALRFGGALLGGAVNLVTPTGRTSGVANQIRLEAGSFETLRAHGEAARTWGEWDGFGALTLIDAANFRDHAATSSARASLNLGRRFGQDREVRFYLSGGDVVQEIPGALSLAEALSNPRASQASVRPDALHSQRNMTSARGSVQSRWRLSDGAVFEGGVYAIWKDLDHPIFQVLDQQSRNFGVFGRLDLAGEVAGYRADAFLGAWRRTGGMDAKRFVNLQSNRGALTALSDETSAATDVFAEGRVWLSPSFAVVAGATYAVAERDFANRLDPSRNNWRDYSDFAPRIGFLWQGEDGAQVYGNVTKSIEAPNMSALSQNNAAFTALEPQEAVTYEIGARGRSGAFVWDISAYHAEIEGELLTFTPGPNIPAATFNAKDTVHRGIEAALDWRIGKRMRLRQTYAYSDFFFDTEVVSGDGLAGNRLPIVPQHFYRAELKYEHPAGWYLAPALEWVPSGAFVDYANTLRAPSYAVVSLGAGLDIAPGKRLFLDVRNLTNEAYVSNFNAVVDAGGDPSTPNFFPGEPFSVFAGFVAEF